MSLNFVYLISLHTYFQLQRSITIILSYTRHLLHTSYYRFFSNQVFSNSPNQNITRFDVYEIFCPHQVLVHKGDQIMNWSGECRDVIPTNLQCQTIQRALQSPNLQREIIRKNITFFKFSPIDLLIILELSADQK